jgi:hypothetical protein
MTPTEFQQNHSGDLKAVLDTPMGKELFNVLAALRPQMPDSFPNEHSMLRAYAKIEGYEMCVRCIVSLTLSPKVQIQPEANYGVPDKQPVK